LGVGIAPLDDIVVLGANDRQAVEIMLARERFHVGNVLSGKIRSEFDDDSAAGEVEVESVFGIERAPIGGLRVGEDQGHGWAVGLSGRGVGGEGQREEEDKNGEGKLHPNRKAEIAKAESRNAPESI